MKIDDSNYDDNCDDNCDGQSNKALDLVDHDPGHVDLFI